MVLAIFAVLYALIIGMFFKFYQDLAMEDAKKEAFHILNTMNAVRDYVATIQRPLIDELKSNGALSSDFFDPRLLSSSYIAREVYNIQREKYLIDYDYKLVATNPLNPAHLGDEFENEILEGFKEGKYQEYAKIVKNADTSYVFVGLPVKNTNATCAVCHNINSAPQKMIERYGGDISSLQGKVGDTIAMVSFKVPVKNILLNHVEEFALSAIVLFVLFAVLVLFIYKIHQKVMKIKEQNKQLMVSQSRLASMGEMIANISHQWKQPLAQIGAVLINLELFNERGKLDNNRLKDKLDEIGEQVKFMSETIDDFKHFFDPNTPKCEYSSEQAIKRVRKILDATLRANAINLNMQIEQNFNHFGNINELIQILINLINNAKDALVNQSNAQREIKITSLVREGIRMIEVENNGKHIKQNEITKIFEPYFTTKATGSGLGLYMSRVIMAKNGGSIEAYNVPNGVKFTIKFLNL
ncbi:MAG: c-type heme family protein [Wolinella sp.]